MEITGAIVNQKEGDFVLEKLRLEEPRADEVKIKIVASGTCHTDMVARDELMGSPTAPMILGHEGAGIVDKVGKSVTKVKEGDHVVLSFGYCGKCDNCRKGLMAYCYHFFELNFGGCRLDGSHSHFRGEEPISDNFFSQSSFATYSIAHENNVVKVPKDAPLELLGPLGCGVQTGAGAVMNTLKPEVGSSIIIAGIGAVGLSAVMAAKAVGCTTIIALDINQPRLDLAKELGATHTINSLNDNVAEKLKEFAERGANYAFDTTGRADVVTYLINGLALRGKCALVGVTQQPLELDMNTFMLRGLQLVGVIEGDSIPDVFIPALVRLFQQGKFPIDKLIKKYPFEKINDAIKDSETGKTIKPIIEIGKYKG